MNGHQRCVRRRSQTLHRYNVMMQRHKERYHKGPVGASGPCWLAYKAWLDVWRAEIVRYRNAELERIRTEENT